MIRIDSRTFKSGNSVAIRLPRELGLEPDTPVTISRVGDTLTIVPRKRLSPAELVAKLRAIGAPPDGVQEREPIEWPERPGL